MGPGWGRRERMNVVSNLYSEQAERLRGPESLTSESGSPAGGRARRGELMPVCCIYYFIGFIYLYLLSGPYVALIPSSPPTLW